MHACVHSAEEAAHARAAGPGQEWLQVGSEAPQLQTQKYLNAKHPRLHEQQVGQRTMTNECHVREGPGLKEHRMLAACTTTIIVMACASSQPGRACHLQLHLCKLGPLAGVVKR